MLFVSAIVSTCLEINAKFALMEARTQLQVKGESRWSFLRQLVWTVSKGWKKGVAHKASLSPVPSLKIGIRGRLRRFWLTETFVPGYLTLPGLRPSLGLSRAGLSSVLLSRMRPNSAKAVMQCFGHTVQDDSQFGAQSIEAGPSNVLETTRRDRRVHERRCTHVVSVAHN